MASFLQSILNRLGGSKTAAPAVYLAAFGKHPGWNDHIDDIGMETERLINVKRILYVQGIGGNIDLGAWDKLTPEEQLPQFRHVFLWHSASDVVIGRLWSSSDGKGRTKYPMIVAAQFDGLPLEWALDEVLPRLERLESECVAATTADGVISTMHSAREQLRSTAQSPRNQAAPPANPLATLAHRPEMGADQRGLLCVLYQLEREMAAFKPNHRPDRSSRSIPLGPRQLRVPAAAETPRDSLLLWTRFLLSQLDPSTPILAIAPLGEKWVDLIVGDPTTPQFFCVRATPAKVPLTSDIPYTLDADFVDRSNKLIAAAH